jgi:hypothetical protein
MLVIFKNHLFSAYFMIKLLLVLWQFHKNWYNVNIFSTTTWVYDPSIISSAWLLQNSFLLHASQILKADGLAWHWLCEIFTSHTRYSLPDEELHMC